MNPVRFCSVLDRFQVLCEQPRACPARVAPKSGVVRICAVALNVASVFLKGGMSYGGVETDDPHAQVRR